MTYPYSHRNRAQGVDPVELHKRGPDGGGGTSINGVVSDSVDVNLPYNSWQVAGVFWANEYDQDLTIKVVPYIDHDQNIEGPAYFLAQTGNTTATSAITLSATATGSDGAVFNVLGGASGPIDTQQFANIAPVHGFKVTVSSTLGVSAGATMDWEFVCVPEA
jgi:hypothetical protein